MRKLLEKIRKRLVELRRDDEGFVVMATLGIFLLLFVLGASIYAVGETARLKIRIQNACDAAAYSAAVVQADGLSRMATINRAMAETYIHMTNLQIDYITYRWLRLTAKRFKEDYDNAKEYHKWIVTSYDPKLGWWAILEVVVDAYSSRLFGAKCNYRHDKEGIGWWCGRGANTKHNIMFNGHRVQSSPQSYEALLKSLAAQSPVMDDSDTSSGDLKDKNTDDDEKETDFEKAARGEIDAINDKYQKQIDALDPSDPEYETKKAALENKRDTELDELAKAYENGKNPSGGGVVDYDAKARAINDKYDELIKKNPDKRDALNEQRRQELARLAGSRSSDAYLDDGGSVASSSVNTQWGSRIAKLIDADKKTIQLLNASLAIVNANMYESMQSTAKFVLTSMLRDLRLPVDMALKNFSAYFYIPRGNNPYQIQDTIEKEENFFSPLYNTEPCERLFLHMARTDKTSDPLYGLFPIGGKAKGTLKGWGLDQWFVRAGKNPDAFPATTRTEGDLGIQRAYKDANINETGAGVVLLKKYVSRGNHIANLHLENQPEENTDNETAKNSVPDDKEYAGYDDWGIVGWKTERHWHHGHRKSKKVPVYGWIPHMDDNIFKKMVSKLLDNLVGSLVDQYCDITPSAGNASSDYCFQMCPKSSDTTALYADYDWASAKWICLNRASFATMWLDYVLCKIFTGRCHGKIFFCNYGSVKHKKKRLFVTFSYTHKGWGHYHFPKWFCGMKPKFQGNASLGISDSVAKWTLLDLLPPLLPEEISGNIHGYMGNTIEWSKFFIPSKPLMSSEDCTLKDKGVSPYHDGNCVLDKKRHDYRSCACFLDGTAASWNYRGFWKLGSSGEANEAENTNLGNDENNGVKPVAGFINGHARIYGDDEEIFDDRYIGEQCRPWILNEKFFSGLGTIVIGAAVKHENPFVQLFNFWGSDDKDMGNTVLSAFDPPSVKGMSFKGKGISGGNCIWAMSAARAGVRRNRRGGELDKERMYQVTYDASCDPHNLKISRAHYYKKGSGWKKGKPPEEDDPKIVAGCVCDGNSKKFKEEWNLCEQDWDATLLPLRYAGQGATSDDGVKWTWKPAADTSGGTAATDVGNKNPLNPHDPASSWRPLDGSSAPPPTLESLLPDGKSRMRLEEILKRNRIL